MPRRDCAQGGPCVTDASSTWVSAASFLGHFCTLPVEVLLRLKSGCDSCSRVHFFCAVWRRGPDPATAHEGPPSRLPALRRPEGVEEPLREMRCGFSGAGTEDGNWHVIQQESEGEHDRRVGLTRRRDVISSVVGHRLSAGRIPTPDETTGRCNPFE